MGDLTKSRASRPARNGAVKECAPVASAPSLSSKEELVLQQLLQSQFWAGKNGAATPAPTDNGSPVPTADPLPETWDLTRGIVLHDWQEQCVESWFQNGKRGVIKVVTGAGKTILALAIAQKLQNEHPSLRVAIIVPTVVLLNQWQDELSTHGNLPHTAIGLMGGGHNDSFSEHIRILICVLNSAAKKLAPQVDQTGAAGELLLIVDECHRAGAAEMKQVFHTKRAFSLGLSATPERNEDPSADADAESLIVGEDEPPPPFEETILGQELGPVVFEMNYSEAIRRGVLPPFRIVHYGLSLDPKEHEKYDGLSREIKELRDELENGSRRGLALIRWCRSRAAAQNPKAAQFLGLASERKRLLYRIAERFLAVMEILRQAFAQNPETKAILFHESIDEVMALFAMLRSAGYAVVAEHSEFPDSMRAESLRLFRQGTAQVIVSARSLIEGFNVPSADLGIVVAASASVRQRVQTLGRLLRRIRTKEGSEKQATLYVLYAAKTVDELIYEKADWEQFVGAERNEYYLWPQVGLAEPKRCSSPPRRPPLDETAVDPSALAPGQPYPGNSDQGQLYSLDTQGTIRDEDGHLLKPNEQVRTILTSIHRTGGRFRITPVNRYVTKLEKTPEGWRSIYLGRLDEALVHADEVSGHNGRRYSPGDIYPLGLVRGKVFSVLQRDKRLIAKKENGSVRFIVPPEKLTESEKHATLAQIQQFLANVYANGQRISKITVTEEGHVVYVYDNQAYFVGNAPEGAEGFVFEQKEKIPA